jgi:hypothetical protein
LGSDDVDENDEGNEDGTGMVILVTGFIIWLFKILYSDWLTSGP